MQAGSLRSLTREKEFWIVVFLGLLYCFRPLFLHETFFYRDLYRHFIPQRHQFVALIRGGELPLWDPSLHGGQPFIADVNNIALYPSGILYLILPFFTAFNLDLSLHVIFCGIASYLLARSLKFSPVPSLIVAAIISFCGYSLSLIQFSIAQFAFLHLPILFLFWHLYLLQKKSVWFLLAAVSGAFQVFAGRPEFSVISLLMLLGWGLTYGYESARSRIFLAWVMLAFFILGLASIQILPTLEMAKQSFRSHMTYSEFTTWSVHPKRLLEIIFPQFLGPTDKLAASSYWGRTLEGAPYTYILSLYFGVAAILLALIGGLYTSDEPKLSSASRKFFLLIVLLVALLSLGRYLPGFGELFGYFPPIRWFRYPVKFLVASIVPLALLAGQGAESVFMKRKAESGTPSIFISVACIAILLFTVLFSASPGFAEAFAQYFFNVSGEHVRSGLQKSFFHAASISILFLLVYLLRKNRVAPWLLAGIICFDLLWAGQAVNPTAPRKYFEDPPPVVATIKKEIGNGKLFRDEVPVLFNINAPSDDIVWEEIWSTQILKYYVAAGYQIPLVFDADTDAMTQWRMIRFKDVIGSVPWQRRIPLISAGGASLILTDDDLSISGLKPIARVVNSSNLNFYLYRNEKTMPPVTFANNWVFRNADDSQLGAILSPNFDPRRDVVLAGADSNLVVRPPATFSAETIHLKANSEEYIVQNNRDGYLVFTKPFFPGWMANVDKKKTALIRANYAFSAIFLQPGKHVVQLIYRPLPFYVGAALSAAAFVMLLSARRKISGLLLEQKQDRLLTM